MEKIWQQAKKAEHRRRYGTAGNIKQHREQRYGKAGMEKICCSVWKSVARYGMLVRYGIDIVCDGGDKDMVWGYGNGKDMVAGRKSRGNREKIWYGVGQRVDMVLEENKYMAVGKA